MIEPVVLFLRLLLSTILLATVFGKKESGLFKPSTKVPFELQILEIIEIVHTPYVLVLAYFVSLGPTIFGLAMLTVLVSSGYLLRKMKLISSCDCYGALARDREKVQGRLNAAVIATGAMLAALGFKSGDLYSIGTDIPSFVICILAACAVSIWSSIGRPRHAGLATIHTGIVEGSRGYTRETVIGKLDSGEDVSLGRIADTCPLMVVIGMTSDCPACKMFKPSLIYLADYFSETLRTVLLVQGVSGEKIVTNNTLVLSSDHNFVADVEELSFPFGMLIKSDTLQPIGDFVFGEDIAALLVRAGSVSSITGADGVVK